MTSHLAQTLTGHGGFSQYLHRFKLKDSPYCACDPAKIQDVLHVLEECPMFLRGVWHWKRRLASLSGGVSNNSTEPPAENFTVEDGETPLRVQTDLSEAGSVKAIPTRKTVRRSNSDGAQHKSQEWEQASCPSSPLEIEEGSIPSPTISALSESKIEEKG
ncbi:hypothetical protein EVAR_86905_1 [Eumeta japonica]|uniref:Retrovirus-related Pol polyprotein from type-1 retrotransposable element R1 n=1 Tax=Eumeta variegata TaxID=151549 RepID=A0A4C1W6L1_EUMVA|nr:hypothetical protein EVAR_86905_1 [Eumeta japonica]